MHDKVKEMYAVIYQSTRSLHVLQLYSDLSEANAEAYKLNREVDNILNKLYTSEYEKTPIKNNKAQVRKCLVSIDD